VKTAGELIHLTGSFLLPLPVAHSAFYGKSLALIVVRRFVRKVAKDVGKKLITIGLCSEVIPIVRGLCGSGAVI
jgi:hypothetical protein